MLNIFYPFLLLSIVSAKTIPLDYRSKPSPHLLNSDSLDRFLRAIKHHRTHRHGRRQASQSSAAATLTLSLTSTSFIPPSTPTAATGMTLSDTYEACLSKLSSMNGTASNQAGISMCYDISSFDGTTGLFQSDIIFFRIAAAQGAWTDLTNGSQSSTVTFPSAQVALASSQTYSVDSNNTSNATDSPTYLSLMQLYGQLDSGYQLYMNNLTMLRAAFTPNVTLYATTPSSSKLAVVLSPSDAAFPTGDLALPPQPPPPTPASPSPSLSPSPSTPAVAAASTPSPSSPTTQDVPVAAFVVPGQSFGIFPTSFVVCVTWTVLFVTLLLSGTYYRAQYREMYRRRTGNGSGRQAPGAARVWGVLHGRGVGSEKAGYDEKGGGFSSVV